MMVAIGIGSIVFAALGSLSLYSARSFSSMANYTDLNKESRHALDQMSREIRQSRGVLSRSATNISFYIDGGIAGATGTLSYAFDSTRKIVTEQKLGGNPIPVLENCRSWTNEIFSRSPQFGSLDFPATSDVSLCKIVRLSWVCESGGSRTNSQSAQSMMVVIRKKPD
jgi:hypothetical protein